MRSVAFSFSFRIGEMMEGERGALEDTEAEELVGFSLAKRQVAATVGVDVYSSNAVLQEVMKNRGFY